MVMQHVRGKLETGKMQGNFPYRPFGDTCNIYDEEDYNKYDVPNSVTLIIINYLANSKKEKTSNFLKLTFITVKLLFLNFSDLISLGKSENCAIRKNVLN